MINPPTQELSCPFCQTKFDNLELLQTCIQAHIITWNHKMIAFKFVELIAQEGKIKENLCPLCGNKTDVEIEVMEDFPYIPKERIEQRIKEISIVGIHWHRFQCGMNHDAEIIKELKDLLKK